MATLSAPYFPIIYVRGYAMTPAEIADAVSSPYMGFNVGATKLRQAWDGQVRRHVFESPLVRLMKNCKPTACPRISCASFPHAKRW